METKIILLTLTLTCVYGITIKKHLKKDTANVCFKIKPKYYDLKDYVNFVNFTLTLLENNNFRSVYRNMQNMKEEIHNAMIKPRDCKELFDFGIRKDGVYKISPTGKTSFNAYCDMKNGGWTVIQRRKYGNVKFDRKWISYAEGFGDLEGDLWLGLRHIHDLTKDNPSQISFRFLMADKHENASALYNGFYIDDEAAKFRMHVKPNAIYNSAIKKYIQYNGFYYHNNMLFSTVDNDNDKSKGSCAQNHGGAGYWFNNCYAVAWINGKFNKMYIYNKGAHKISRSEVKIRRAK